jgi:hypothetical protein
VDDYAKSVGYALRNAFAQVSGMIVNNVSVFIVLSAGRRGRSGGPEGTVMKSCNSVGAAEAGARRMV